MTHPLWRSALVGGTLLGVLWASAPTVGLREALWTALVAGACLTVLLAVRVHRPRTAGPWLVLAVALASLTANNLMLNHGLLGSEVVPVAMALELAAFPLLAAATLWLLRCRVPGGDGEGVLDGLIVMIALATLLSSAVLTPDALPTGSGLERIVALVAPLVLAAVVTAALRLLLVGGRPVPSAVLVVLSTLAALAGHVLRTTTQTAGTYERGGIEDAWIAAAYLCMALAAAHPSMRPLTEPAERTGRRVTHLRIGLLGAALLVAPATYLLRDAGDSAMVLVASGAVVSLLVLGRLWLLVVERERVRDELRTRATRDGLTGLPNRAALLQHLEGALARGARAGTTTAVLFVDLDGFKRVNDAHGHRAGDAVLVAAADRLATICRQGDLVARLAGDEFVLVTEQARESGLPALADRIIDGLGTVTAEGAEDTRVAASVGIAARDGEPADPELLLAEADAAMYQAKGLGGARWARFGEELGGRLRRRRDLELALREALRAGGLHLHHQPIVRLDGDAERVVGYEALVRWTHPDLGAVPPSELIGVAEANGLICDVGAWVLTEACAELVRLRRGLPDDAELSMFVNVSPRELASRTLPAVVAEALRSSGARPADVVLEVTETAVIDDLEDAVGALRELRAMGVRIALDDFGTGYSSLTHLKALPLDLVKIDASFVAGIGHAGSDRAIVEAVLGIAAHLGADVVGEGVEHPWQLEALRGLGCQLAQGYLLGRPAPAPVMSPAI